MHRGEHAVAVVPYVSVRPHDLVSFLLSTLEKGSLSLSA